MVKYILNKIIITGDAGRGKSTLASSISSKLGIQNYSTDDFYYEIKFTKIRDRQKSVEEISKIYGTEKWIVEGTTEHLLRSGLGPADAIIHLKHRNLLAQWAYLLKRHFRRDNESIYGVLHLMRHVLYKKYKLGYRKGMMTVEEFITPYKGKTTVLASFKEIDDFVNSL